MIPVKILGSGSILAKGTKVVAESGAEIPGVTSISTSIEPDSVVKASIEICAEFDELAAIAEFNLEDIEQMANAHGYKLVPVDDGCKS